MILELDVFEDWTQKPRQWLSTGSISSPGTFNSILGAPGFSRCERHEHVVGGGQGTASLPARPGQTFTPKSSLAANVSSAAGETPWAMRPLSLSTQGKRKALFIWTKFKGTMQDKKENCFLIFSPYTDMFDIINIYQTYI